MNFLKIKDRVFLMILYYYRNLQNYFLIQIRKNLKLKKFQDLDKQKDVFVNFSTPILQLDKELKNFLKEKMYNNKIVKQNTDRGKKIIENLFKKIKKKRLEQSHHPFIETWIF